MGAYWARVDDLSTKKNCPSSYSNAKNDQCDCMHEVYDRLPLHQSSPARALHHEKSSKFVHSTDRQSEECLRYTACSEVQKHKVQIDVVPYV